MSNLENSQFNNDYYENLYFEKNAWQASAKPMNTLYVFTGLFLGSDTELGRKSFTDFITTLAETDQLPKAIVFWNEAVEACTESREELSSLIKLEKLGVKILLCSSAVTKLNIQTMIRVGKIANHFDLIHEINSAQKVINF